MPKIGVKTDVTIAVLSNSYITTLFLPILCVGRLNFTISLVVFCRPCLHPPILAPPPAYSSRMAARCLKPFHLLEISIISAQDLKPVSKKMRTYATAWVHPKRKLATAVDAHGGNNPSWNDKFVFRVDDDFLRRDSTAVTVEIYAVHWLRDTLVGSLRLLVGNFFNSGVRFAALQVRRRSGRPQGILNVGVVVLDGSMRSMPLSSQLGANSGNDQTNPKPILSRSRSERKVAHGKENAKADRKNEKQKVEEKNNNGSKLNAFDFRGPKGSSMVNGKYIYGRQKKAQCFLTDSDVGPSPSEVAAAIAKEREMRPLDDKESSALGGWSLDGTVEGLRSRLERWRMELPPQHNRGGFGGRGSSGRSSSHHHVRQGAAMNGGRVGLFSCFGKICCFECECVCGKPSPTQGRSLRLSSDHRTSRKVN
ncbi:uncharacterized protein LOC127812158 [Diospyros lotus]|uniref:uncharacterized protein LOC127812158 n=1 Tax=Diospyros lotus TaxID=55363 RepID=UPI0022584AC0|nr:uncharacterized protein LOC127812158 [Diospyros lotus]